MSATCGCCSGIRKLTPAAVKNRPGLAALQYRAGTHAQFLRTMKERLSSLQLAPEDFENLPPDAIQELRPLLALTTREQRDPAIALLDAWALVADILTFYQERIANEGYLRTATERRSILELTRLIGYRARPGVAASVYLAYTLEKDARVVIPGGSRAQTVPGPGELPQPFETSNDLDARDTWNVLRPRASEPQLITLGQAPALDDLWFTGITTRLKPGDPLLLVFNTTKTGQVLRRVRTVEPDAAANRTRVTLVKPPVTATTTTTTAPDLDHVAVAAQEVVARHGDVKRAGVSARSKAVRETLSRLQEVEGMAPAELEERLPAIIGGLRETQAKSPKVEPWLAGIIDDLESLRQMFEAPAPHEALAFAEHPGAEPAQSPTVGAADPLIEALELPPSVPPANALQLPRDHARTFAGTSDTGTRLLTVLRPSLGKTLYQALGSVRPPAPAVQVYAFRVNAPLFGYNATPTRPRLVNDSRNPNDDQWHVVEPIYTNGSITSEVVLEQRDVVNLDAAYDSILPATWIVVQTPAVPHLTTAQTLIGTTGAVRSGIGRGVYGVSGKTTRIGLRTADGSAALNWLTGDLTLPDTGASEFPTKIPIANDFEAIRQTSVFAQPELLELAERPYHPVTAAICGSRIQLGAFTGELEPGRWLVVSGERTDIPGVTGVFAAELVMLAGIEHSGNATATETRFSTLLLAKPLAYCYRRDSVTIYGNVAHATHGETHEQALGSGDAGEAMQSFTLPESPLTYLAAATPAGAESTLEVRVDDLLWHEANTLLCAGPNDRLYFTRTDDDDATTIVFGDGKAGARLPTGHENVRGKYRIGIGAVGNASAGQISMLATRELGVKSVVNPIAATGGANREDGDQIRRNAPLAVTALDRLVSVRDYEDFARTFAGIAKADAVRISDGRRQLVHVTIAGTDDVPIGETSDLFVNLRKAMLQFGDPAQPLRLAVRKLHALVISAKVRIGSDYLWEAVEPKIRAALLDGFSFTRRDLGQDALSSEVLALIQSVPGVVYADLDIFDSVKETITRDALETLAASLTLNHRILIRNARRDTTKRVLTIEPAELAYLSPALPDTLILTELIR